MSQDIETELDLPNIIADRLRYTQEAVEDVANILRKIGANQARAMESKAPTHSAEDF